MTCIRIRRTANRLPHRGESDRVQVPAGWYDTESGDRRVFCPRQIGRLVGGYIDQSQPGAVLFVQVNLAVADSDL